MAAYQYVYVMKDLTTSYPGGREIFKGITLSFLPGVKIGVVGVNGTGKACPVKCCRRCDGPGLDGRHIGGIGREVASRQLGQHMGGIDQRVLHHLTCTGLDFGREDLQDEQRRQPVDQEKAEQQAQSQTDTESALHGVAGSARL